MIVERRRRGTRCGAADDSAELESSKVAGLGAGQPGSVSNRAFAAPLAHGRRAHCGVSLAETGVSIALRRVAFAVDPRAPRGCSRRPQASGGSTLRAKDRATGV